jgi:uncharacterized protein (DUF58 family)
MIVRPPFFVFLGLLILSGVAAYLTQEATVFVYYRILYLLLLIMAVGLVSAYFSLRGITIVRSSRVMRQQVGQVFEERFEIRNNSWLGRVWIEIDDLTLMPGRQGSRVISNIGAKQQRSYYNRTLLIKRGAFLLGPSALISGDLFGLFAVKKVVPGEKTLIVLPYMVNLTTFPAPAGKLPGGRALHRKSLEVTPYAAGVREYVPGDPLNRIHWKSTARKDRLIVKEFEQDPQADVWILLDAQEGLHLELPDIRRIDERDQFWVLPHRLEIQLPASTFEYAISCAASIANYFITQGQSLGFASAGKTLTILPAERGERQLAKILERLAFLQPDGQLPLMGLVESQANQIARGSTVVIITTAFGEGVDLVVDVLMRRDLRPVILFVDPQSFGANFSVAETVERIKAYGIPVKTIRKDDPIQEILEGMG